MSARSPAARSFVLAAALAAAVAAPSIAGAQVPLINGLGGTVGYGTDCLAPNDDGSSRRIDITPAFPTGLRFFDRTHTSMFVNTNGNITFSAALSQYTPDMFPIADQPMIAPYWADVDIRPSGCGGIGEGFTDVSGRACPNPANNGVWWRVEPGRIVVTWHRVGYYRCHLDRRMNFQMVLTAAPDCGPGGAGNFNVEFRYNECNWTTGDASGGSGGFGGTPAQAGFDAGNRMDFVEIMNSRTGTIHTTLCSMSNVGMPGIWQFQIRGGTVMCPGAGGACDTGRPGVCGDGRLQCVGSGTSCVGTNAPGARRCNGLDNDCDGTVDTGDDLCAAGFVCDRSACVARCVEGSCFAGETCTARGTCVETSCADVTCPAGQACRAGACVGACEGVRCPHGQECRAGRCTDPCAGLTCETGSVCVNGLCSPTCPCATCATGEACAPDGRCVPTGCEGMTCPPGQFCRAGGCADACEGAMCPAGERCEAGNCVAVPVEADAGVAADSGVEPRDSGVEPRDSGVEPGADSGVRADGGRRDGGTFVDRQPSCGCRIEGAGAAHTPWALGAALGAALAIRSRRRRGGR